MTTSAVEPSTLDHELHRYFKDLAQFQSTEACTTSTIYSEIRPELERVLGGIEQGSFSPADSPRAGVTIRVAAWNIERGIQLDGVLEVLSSDPTLAASELLLLTEVDYGMARTANRHVAREIAAGLGVHYAFAPCYLALNKGAGVEAEAEGENTLALHGNAIMSRFPLRNAHTLALPNGKDKMVGREKRLGSQHAIIADVDHPLGTFRTVALHMDAHSSQRHRHRQMRMLLDHLEGLEPRLPVLIGGELEHNNSQCEPGPVFHSGLRSARADGGSGCPQAALPAPGSMVRTASVP